MDRKYKFIRLGKGLLWVKSDIEKEYLSIIEQHAKEGWRLVQVFAPGTGFYGTSRYFEITIERPVLY